MIFRKICLRHIMNIGFVIKNELRFSGTTLLQKEAIYEETVPDKSTISPSRSKLFLVPVLFLVGRKINAGMDQSSQFMTMVMHAPLLLNWSQKSAHFLHSAPSTANFLTMRWQKCKLINHYLLPLICNSATTIRMEKIEGRIFAASLSAKYCEWFWSPSFVVKYYAWQPGKMARKLQVLAAALKKEKLEQQQSLHKNKKTIGRGLNGWIARSSQEKVEKKGVQKKQIQISFS